ncbi:hypothetical protein AB4Z17_02000 [Paenibacillus sp. TAF43_2]|uniref:hypothetical protein n=1 Tax=Paenibacillus sp. TAF43_2 TaxID=3233069 RepID=UPI003F9C6A8D
MSMSYYFNICSTAKYQEAFITFLLEHFVQLNLPYSFPVSLSYLSSPLFMEKESILFRNPDDEIIGAIGYIHGTGDQNYENEHIVQIQTVFIKESYRSTRLFLQASQFLAQYLAQLKQPVTELRFWIPAQPNLQRLCAKSARKVAVQDTDHGVIEEYVMDFTQWHDDVMKYPHEIYF